MTTKREVCGGYPGAVPWTTHSDEPPAQLAAALARSAGCTYFTVDGVTYGPFDESAEEETETADDYSRRKPETRVGGAWSRRSRGD